MANAKKTSKKKNADEKLTLKLGKKKLRLTEDDVAGISGGAPSSTVPNSGTTCCHCDLCPAPKSAF